MSVVAYVIIGMALLAGVIIGIGLSVLTGTPLVAVWQERQRVEREARLAELQLRHLSHQAMQRLLNEARRS